MRGKRGIAPVVTGLLVVVIVLAAVATYLGALALQPRPTANVGAGVDGLGQRFVISAGPSAGASVQVQGSDGSPQYAISVGGTSQVGYTPNEALLTLTVVTDASTAQAATSANAASMAKVIQSLNSIGVTNSSVQTQGYTLSPYYSNNYGNNTPPTITGYGVSNSLLVNLTSDSASQLGLKSGQAIDTAVAAGADQVSLEFTATSSLMARLNTLALQSAIASARDQAQVMATSLGVNITGVVSATEGYSQPYYGSTPTFAAGATTATPIMPGTQYESATVTVVYSIS